VPANLPKISQQLSSESPTIPQGTNISELGKGKSSSKVPRDGICSFPGGQVTKPPYFVEMIVVTLVSQLAQLPVKKVSPGLRTSWAPVAPAVIEFFVRNPVADHMAHQKLNGTLPTDP